MNFKCNFRTYRYKIDPRHQKILNLRTSNYLKTRVKTIGPKMFTNVSWLPNYKGYATYVHKFTFVFETYECKKLKATIKLLIYPLDLSRLKF